MRCVHYNIAHINTQFYHYLLSYSLFSERILLFITLQKFCCLFESSNLDEEARLPCVTRRLCR